MRTMARAGWLLPVLLLACSSGRAAEGPVEVAAMRTEAAGQAPAVPPVPLIGSLPTASPALLSLAPLGLPTAVSLPAAASQTALAAIPAALPSSAGAAAAGPASASIAAGPDAARASAAPAAVAPDALPSGWTRIPGPTAPKAGRPALRSIHELLGQLKRELEDSSAWEPLSGQAPGAGIARLGARGQSIALHNEETDETLRLPVLVKIVSRDEAGRPVIQIPVVPGGRPTLYQTALAPEAAAILRTAPDRHVDARLRDLRLAISPHVFFQPGETVRVRDESTGRIERMTYTGLAWKKGTGTKVELRDSDGRLRLSPTRLVYKDLGAGEPATVEVSMDEGLKMGALMTPLEAERGSVLESFLDGATWLSSHPEFLSARHEERWSLLAGYTQAVMRHDDAALMSELLSLDLSDLLQLGVGVCRHLATLTAAALKEAGYDARIMIHHYGSDGHAWVEVRAPAGSGAEDWIIDATNGVAMRAGETAKSEGAVGRAASLWYSHPDRMEYPTSTRPAR